MPVGNVGKNGWKLEDKAPWIPHSEYIVQEAFATSETTQTMPTPTETRPHRQTGPDSPETCSSLVVTFQGSHQGSGILLYH